MLFPRTRRRRWGAAGVGSGQATAGKPARGLRHLSSGARLRLPFEALSLLLMTFVMPCGRLSQIVGSSQLGEGGEALTFLHAINRACLILGIIIVAAIIPSLLRGPRSTGSAVGRERGRAGSARGRRCRRADHLMPRRARLEAVERRRRRPSSIACRR